MAGPDWQNISYPTDGAPASVDPAIDPDPISYTPPDIAEPAPEQPEAADPVEETPTVAEPVVEAPIVAEPVPEQPEVAEPVAEIPLVSEPDADTPAGTEEIDGTVVYRWNAGRKDVEAIDEGPDWISDVSAVVDGHARVKSEAITTLDSSVSQDTVPLGVFSQYYLNPNSSSEMALEFGDGTLDAGEYAVRLYMGNAWNGTDSSGDLQFDVSVEDQLFLDDIDLIDSFGHKKGGMFEWVGQVDDGTIDIDFGHVIRDPIINGVEILQLNTSDVVEVIEMNDDENEIAAINGFDDVGIF